MTGEKTEALLDEYGRLFATFETTGMSIFLGAKQDVLAELKCEST